MLHLSWIITLTLVLLSGRTVEGAQPCERFGVGISNRDIVRDGQITASSSLGLNNRPFHARIGSTRGSGWCVRFGTRPEEDYLQIDLERDYVFCGIRVQGGAHGHVDRFKLGFAQNKGSFIPFGKTFNRFTKDEEEEEFHSIAPFPIGRIVRFYPLVSEDLPCARIELYGFPGPTVTCRPQYIIAEFKRSFYQDLEAPEMHLKNESCLAESANITHITFHIPFRACQTVRTQTNDYLEYHNEVIRRITQGLITYKMDMNFPITCKYDRNVTLDDLNIKVKEDEEPTTADPGGGARLQPLLWLLVSLWLSGTFLCWVSVAERTEF